MEKHNIKKAAYLAAIQDDANIEKDIAGMSAQDRLYYLQMLYYYRLFHLGKITLAPAKEIEHRINLDNGRMDHALWLSEQNYRRQVQLALETNAERTKLAKQLAAGDHGFLETLLHLLDLYSGEMVYCQMYRAMQPPMTDEEFEQMIAEVPKEYRHGMTKEESRAAVWNVVRQLNRDDENLKVSKNSTSCG
jgi:hypothetical protein